ncbi:MAG: cupin domain-containing protein [Bacteroidetes bacterium]|nr:cupin domain-containing protein [Bacteroidota bacterium]
MPIANLKDQKEIEIIPGYFVKFIHGEQMTTAHFRIMAGAETPEHSHPHEQVSNIISGRFELTVDGTPYILDKEKVFLIPSNVKHKGKALTDCRIIDVFSPVREDYRKLSK